MCTIKDFKILNEAETVYKIGSVWICSVLAVEPDNALLHINTGSSPSQDQFPTPLIQDPAVESSWTGLLKFPVF
jgi:hypothetical protein